jgi:hypothetical protein
MFAAATMGDLSRRICLGKQRQFGIGRTIREVGGRVATSIDRRRDMIGDSRGANIELSGAPPQRPDRSGDVANGFVYCPARRRSIPKPATSSRRHSSQVEIVLDQMKHCLETAGPRWRKCSSACPGTPDPRTSPRSMNHARYFLSSTRAFSCMCRHGPGRSTWRWLSPRQIPS